MTSAVFQCTIMIDKIGFILVVYNGRSVRLAVAGDLIQYHRLDNWPRIPIFLSQVTGYWPTLQSVVAQIGLLAIYLLGALYAFVLRPRRHRAGTPTTPATPSTPSTLVNA